MLLLQAMACLGCSGAGSFGSQPSFCLWLVSLHPLARSRRFDAVFALPDAYSHRCSSLWTTRDGRPGDTLAMAECASPPE